MNREYKYILFLVVIISVSVFSYTYVNTSSNDISVNTGTYEYSSKYNVSIPVVVIAEPGDTVTSRRIIDYDSLVCLDCPSTGSTSSDSVVYASTSGYSDSSNTVSDGAVSWGKLASTVQDSIQLASGSNDNYATYSHSGLTAEDEGKVVKFTSNNTVGRCSDNDLFVGVVIEIVGDDCIVQIEGVVTVDATTGGFQVGWGTAVANSTGGIKYASPAIGKPMYKIISIDTSGNEITFVVG